MDLLLDAVVIGVLLGCFYAAVSLGLSVAFGLLDVPHVAHPAFLVLASYAVFFLNEHYGIDPLLAGRSDQLEVKNILYEQGRRHGFVTVHDQIEAHLAAGRRVFVYNLVLSRWALAGLNNPSRNPYGDRYQLEDFTSFVSDLQARYDLVPVLRYWEESQQPLYLFGQRLEPLLQVRRRS